MRLLSAVPAIVVFLALASPAAAATYTVSTTADTGAGSLRNAVALANAGGGGDVIVVPASAAPYVLTSGQLTLTKPVTITGAGAATTTISGNGTSRILDFQSAGPNTISGLTLTGGHPATNDGGAVHASGGVLTVASVVASGNTAPRDGGALQMGGNGSSSDRLTITGSTFSGNRAGGYGGALSTGGGGSSNDTLSITSSTFAGNSAGDTNAGGAIEAGGGGGNTDTATISDSTVTGNSVKGALSAGGGLALFVATSTLVNDTIDANSASGAGGGIYAGSALTLINTIVSGNHGTPAERANCDAPVLSQGHNIEDGTSCGFPSAPADPLLGPLQDNGGPTPTQELLPGSPAIDAGESVRCGPLDQRGVHRPVGLACDIGALELAPPSASTSAASGVGQTTASLSGTATNPGPAAGTTFFAYGPTSAYGQQTPAQALGAGSSAVSLTAALTELPSGTLLHFRAVAVTPDGTAFGADQTFTTAAAATAPAAPALRGLALSPKAFVAASGRGASIARKKRRAGATLSYTDSEPARTTFTVRRRIGGVRVKGRCVARAPRRSAGKPRRCTRQVPLGTFTHADAAGANRFTFTGRINRRPLAAGRYTLQAVARNGAGQRSNAPTIPFRIIGGPGLP